MIWLIFSGLRMKSIRELFKIKIYLNLKKKQQYFGKILEKSICQSLIHSRRCRMMIVYSDREENKIIFICAVITGGVVWSHAKPDILRRRVAPITSETSMTFWVTYKFMSPGGVPKVIIIYKKIVSVRPSFMFIIFFFF